MNADRRVEKEGRMRIHIGTSSNALYTLSVCFVPRVLFFFHFLIVVVVFFVVQTVTDHIFLRFHAFFMHATKALSLHFLSVYY